MQTVSNVVNGYPHVAEATRARVHAAISDLKYRPNLAARSLRSGRSGLIGLALPELDVPYFAEIARLVVEEAAAHGFTVLAYQTGGVRENEQLFISGIRSQLIDAVIFTPVALARDDLKDWNDQVPMVLLGETVEDGLNQVGIDSLKAGAAATRHLIELGRQRIAAIGAPVGRTASTAHVRRLQGYRQALKDARIGVDPELVPEVSTFHPTEGSRAMAQLLDLGTPPDAVFCFNDLLALGAIRQLLTRGYRVPDDVAVIGFDDIEECKYVTPTLSTVSPDKREIARIALACVFSLLGLRESEPPHSTEISFRVLARESTLGPAP
jgi:DNA-binding LacI/PurR family transcriptional regulator